MALPSKYSLSIASPASYWYLRAFPIAEMSKYLDYIVFMTYDFHGQWDYDNQKNNPKSTVEPLLRSHVNWTETVESLTLITNAGVPSNKVLMGLGSYGRSFQQVDPSCSGPMCKFTGAGATPGRCTQTRGYLGLGEIEEIIKNGSVRNQVYDAQSDSMIMTYNSNDWIAYTDQEIMMKRITLAKSMNLAGTVEWAIDLQSGTTIPGEAYTPIAMAVNFDSPPCSHDSSKSIQEIADSAKRSDTSTEDFVSDCAMEQLAYKLKDLSHEGLDKLNRLIYGGAPALNHSAAVGSGFHEWLVHHIDDYFACSGLGTASLGCNKGLTWVHSDKFYQDIKTKFGLESWMIVNGSKSIAGECTDGRPVHCNKPTVFSGNFPSLAPSKVTDTTFSDVFKNIYLPYMLDNTNKMLQNWMLSKVDGSRGSPTKMDSQFRCASKPQGLCFIERFKCGRGCESTLEPKDMSSLIQAINKDLKWNLTQENFEFRDFKVEEMICIPEEMPAEGICPDHLSTTTYHQFPYLLKNTIADPIAMMGDLSKIKDILAYMDKAITEDLEDYETIVMTSMNVVVGLLTTVDSMEAIMREAANIVREDSRKKDEFMVGMIETFFMLSAYTLPGIGPIVGATWNVLPLAIHGVKDPIAWIMAAFDIVDALSTAIKLGRGFRGARRAFDPVKYEKFMSTYEKDIRIQKIKETETKVSVCPRK
eukprot:gene16622-19747_t